MSALVPLFSLAVAVLVDEDIPAWKRPWTPRFPPLTESDLGRPASLAELLEETDSLMEEKDALGLARLLVPKIWPRWIEARETEARRRNIPLSDATLTGSNPQSSTLLFLDSSVQVGVHNEGRNLIFHPSFFGIYISFAMDEPIEIDDFWPDPPDTRIEANRIPSNNQQGKLILAFANRFQGVFGKEEWEERTEFRTRTIHAVADPLALTHPDLHKEILSFVRTRWPGKKGQRPRRREPDFLELMTRIEVLRAAHGL